MLQDVKDQSDSFYISYVRQVARKSKNMNLLAEFSWIFSMETAESERQYNIEHMCKADKNNFCFQGGVELENWTKFLD